MKTKNEYGQYSVELSATDAGALLSLIKGMDLHPMTIPEIVAHAKLQAHLEMIAEAEKELQSVAK